MRGILRHGRWSYYGIISIPVFDPEFFTSGPKNMKKKDITTTPRSVRLRKKKPKKSKVWAARGSWNLKIYLSAQAQWFMEVKIHIHHPIVVFSKKFRLLHKNNVKKKFHLVHTALMSKKNPPIIDLESLIWLALELVNVALVLSRNFLARLDFPIHIVHTVPQRHLVVTCNDMMINLSDKIIKRGWGCRTTMHN